MKKKDLPIMILLILFYLFWGIVDGPIEFPDSHSYIYMNIGREPLYCIFLAINRTVFGVNYYLNVVAIIQSLLMAVAVFAFLKYVYERFEMSNWCKTLLFCVFIGVSLLSRFGSKTAALYSNTILSEGLAIPLYILFVKCVLEYYLEGKRSALIISALLSMLLISTRKQMLFTIVVLAFTTIIKEIKWRKIWITVVTISLILVSNLAFDVAYTFAVNGVATRHTSDYRFLATMAFYASERNDAEVFEDPELKELFLKIYDEIDDENALMHSAPDGIVAETEYFGNHYDIIQIDHMWPAFMNYVFDKYEFTNDNKDVLADELTVCFIKKLLPSVWGKILHVCLLSFIQGMVNTVSKTHPILYAYSAMFWVLYIALIIRSIITKGMNDANRMACIVLFSTLLNVLLVALMIFCQTRYMIYNMPLAYVTIIVMIEEFYKDIKKKKLLIKEE